MKQLNLVERVWQDPVYFIAFGFGSGLMPFAPGTWGTLAAFPVYLLLAKFSSLVYLLITALLFVLGSWTAEKVSQDLGVHDYQGIVWDEVVGYLLTMWMAPMSLSWMLLGFVLFRIFDIWKPFPIRQVDRYVKGGVGIMLDDVLAAVPAWLLMQVCLWGLAR